VEKTEAENGEYRGMEKTEAEAEVETEEKEVVNV